MSGVPLGYGHGYGLESPTDTSDQTALAQFGDASRIKASKDAAGANGAASAAAGGSSGAVGIGGDVSLSVSKEPLRNRGGKVPLIRREGGGGMETIKKLREDMIHISEKIERLFKEKVDLGSVQDLISTKAETFDLDRKADVRILDAIERSLRNVMNELGDVKALHEEELARVKDAMERNMKKTLKAMFATHEDQSKPSFLATKSLCLSCGRNSLVKSTADPTSPPNFLPALHSASTPGPEVFRAGFKMPIHPRDGLFTAPAMTQQPAKGEEIDQIQVLPPTMQNQQQQQQQQQSGEEGAKDEAVRSFYGEHLE